MKAYSLLNYVLDRVDNVDTSFFYNREDAEKNIGGYLICGQIKDNSEYLHTSEPLDEITCDAVINNYGDITFLYLVEE